MGVLFCLIGECLPVAITKLFVSDAPLVFEAAPFAFRLFFPVFLFLGIVVDADYYLQSVMREKNSIAMGLMHSVILSGLFCMALPKLLGMTGIWIAIPLSDMLTAFAGLMFVKKIKNRLDPHAAS